MPKTLEQLDDEAIDKNYINRMCESMRDSIMQLEPSKPGLDKGASFTSLELRLDELSHYALHFPDSEYLIQQWKSLHDFAKEHLPEGIYKDIYKR